MISHKKSSELATPPPLAGPTKSAAAPLRRTEPGPGWRSSLGTWPPELGLQWKKKAEKNAEVHWKIW